MAYPISGSPAVGTAASVAYSGTFIPEIWSSKLVEKFYDATVLAAISNTDYEGEIKNQGDKVKIRTKPSITIRTYDSGQALQLERPSSNVIELLIDKGYYWNTVIDDVMETQMDINAVSLWSSDATEQMKITVDTYVLGTISAGIAAANKGATAGRISGNINLGVAGTPIVLTTANVIDYIVYLGQVLDEQNVPESGRWIVIPAWMASLIKRSDLKDAALTGDSVTPLRNGKLGMIDRFTVYQSNLLPYVSGDTAHRIFAGVRSGLTFAAQISKVESMRSELTFGQIMRGLHIFGSKMVDGTMVAELYAKKG